MALCVSQWETHTRRGWGQNSQGRGWEEHVLRRKGKETVTSSTLLFHSLFLGYVGSALSRSPTNSPTEACSFHLSVYLTVAYSSTLKMEVARSCRTLVNFYQTTQCHISILENLNTIFFMFSHLSKYSQKFSKRWPYYPKTRERIKLVYFSSHMWYLKVL